MNGEFDPLGAVFMLAWLAVVGAGVRKLFRRPRRTIWDWLLLILGVLLAPVVYLAGFFLYAFVRAGLDAGGSGF